MGDIFNKYSRKIIKNLDRNNLINIIMFLKKENCDYIIVNTHMLCIKNNHIL